MFNFNFGKFTLVFRNRMRSFEGFGLNGFFSTWNEFYLNLGEKMGHSYIAELI